MVAKIYAALPAPQHFLNFLLLPQLQGSLGFTRADFASVSPGAYDGGCRVKWCGLRLVMALSLRAFLTSGVKPLSLCSAKRWSSTLLLMTCFPRLLFTRPERCVS